MGDLFPLASVEADTQSDPIEKHLMTLRAVLSVQQRLAAQTETSVRTSVDAAGGLARRLGVAERAA